MLLLGVFGGAFSFTTGRYCGWTHLHSGDDDTRSASEPRGQLAVFTLATLPVLVILLLAAR